MTDREMLINEINLLPDFVIKQLLDIVHYLRRGIDYEYAPQTENEFYNSVQFKAVISDAIKEYQSGKTEELEETDLPSAHPGHLDSLIGLAELGGDALKDTENVFDESLSRKFLPTQRSV